MRHLVAYLCIILMLVACSEPLDINFEKEERLLQMDAIMDSSDTLHRVYLCWSTSSGVEPIMEDDHPIVSMYINGSKQSDARLSSEQDAIYLTGKYSAGDVVKLVAVVGDYCVEAEVVAPSEAFISSVDTTKFEWTEYFDVTVNDVVGENNYYRISMWKEWRADVTEVYSWDSPVKPGYNIGEWKEEICVFGDEEPILVSKYGLSPAYRDVNEDSWDMNIFSDKLFRDKQYNIRLKTRYAFIPSIPFYSSRYKVVSNMLVTLRLHSMSVEAYRYFEDYAFEFSENSFFMAYPTIYPSNVKGGIGFVTAMTSTDYVMEFPHYSFWAGRRNNPVRE